MRVTYEATLTNQKPNQVSGGVFTQYFLPEYGVPVLAEAVNLRAVEGGEELPVRLEDTETPRFKAALVDLQPNLFFGATQTVRLTYDLPRVPPRSDGFTRLNDAYATFPALAFGDPGITSVEIRVPEGFEVELVGNEMEESLRDGLRVFTSPAIAEPEAWEVLVSARDDSKLIARQVDVGEAGVTVLGWPDDPEWADFAEEQVTEGVPVLERLIGIDWPADTSIDVVETSSPYLYGYAGWYRPLESVIEVGDELDAHVMLHELAHIWFNDDLFEGRWINEAFADTLAAEVVGELGGDAPEPRAIDATDPGKLQLNDWSNPDLQAGISEAQERFGYNASWAVLSAVVDEIGMEALAQVIRAADAGEIAYRGPGVPEELGRQLDWKELLDLLEEVGGSAEAASLFERRVVGASDAELFAARSAARERYEALVAAGEGWAAPTSIRSAMADWRFPSAEGLIDQATDILDRKDELLERTADLDVSDDLALRATYEGGKDLGDVADAAADAIRAADAVGDAEDAVEGGAGPIGAVGLLLDGADDELDDAQRAFDDGDYEAAMAAAAGAEDVVDGAPARGGLLLLGVVALLLVALLLRRRLRTRRRRSAAADAQRGRPDPALVAASGSAEVGQRDLEEPSERHDPDV